MTTFRLSKALAMVSALSLLAAIPARAGELELERIRLYDSGVAYFERSGRLDPARGSALPVPPGHLDDALKTLVILSEGGKARVSRVEFPSSVSGSMGRALLGLDEEGKAISAVALWRSLEGAQVELRTRAGMHRGRVVDVAQPDPRGSSACAEALESRNDAKAAQCERSRSPSLVTMADDGVIRSVSAPDVLAVRPLEKSVVERLRTALGAVGPRRELAERALRVIAAGGKTVRLAYVAEAPVWRSTYRLVFDAASPQAMLQGWALLHNDTDESWDGVRVELVNGRPDSFLFPLAAPRYAPRELVTPERNLTTVPQLLDTTVDNLGDREMTGMAGLGLSGVGQGGFGAARGAAHGRLGSSHRAGPSQSSFLKLGNLASTAPAAGEELGALFLYALPSPVSLKARSSALVSFVRELVGARRIAWFQKPGASARSAVILTNDTRQTLPRGVVSIFSDGGFVGESEIGRLKSSERTLIRFGTDLDVELEEMRVTRTELPRHVTRAPDSLVEHFVRKREIVLSLVNRHASARTAALELDVVDNARIDGSDEVGYDTDRGRPYVLFDVDANQRRRATLVIEEGLSRRHDRATTPAVRLAKLAAHSTLPEGERKVLRRAAKHLHRSEAVRRRLVRLLALHRTASLDLADLRLDISAIGRAPAQANAKRLTERLVAVQDRVSKQRTRLHAMRRQIAAREDAAWRELGQLR